MKTEPESSTKASSVSAKVYTCPMHPEVVSNEPGRCQKCNMALELRKS